MHSFAHSLPILLVDDNTTSLMELASMLEQFSFRVTTTELASVGLSMIQQRPARFNLVIAKVNMKDMHILSFVRSVMKRGIPVILCSSSSEENIDLAKKGLVEGASYFMENPISMEDLRYVWQIAFQRKVNQIKKIKEVDDPQIMVNYERNENKGTGTNKHVTVSGGVAAPEGTHNRDLTEIDLQKKVKDFLDELVTMGSKKKNIEIIVEEREEEKSEEIGEEERRTNDSRGKNRNMEVGECSYAPREKNKQVEEGYPTNDQKGKSKIIVVEEPLNQLENEAQEQQNALIDEQMMTEERQEEEGSPTNIANEEINELNENGKRMAVDSNEERNPNNNDIERADDDQNEKSNENEEREGQVNGKRPRLSWTLELQRKFTAAVSALGDRKCRPKMILKMMNEPNLTLRQVGSHLQKHRQQMKRLQEIGKSGIPSSTVPANTSAETRLLQAFGKNKSFWSQSTEATCTTRFQGTNNIMPFSYPNRGAYYSRWFGFLRGNHSSQSGTSSRLPSANYANRHYETGAYSGMPSNINANRHYATPNHNPMLPSTSYGRRHNATGDHRSYGTVNHRTGFSSFPGSSIQRQQAHNFVDLTQDQPGRFVRSTNVNQVDEMGNLPYSFNWHDNVRENQLFLSESSSAHMSDLNLPNAVNSHMGSRERFQFPNVMNDANQGRNSETGGFAQTINEYDVGVDKQLFELPTGSAHAPETILPKNTDEYDSLMTSLEELDFTEVFCDVQPLPDAPDGNQQNDGFRGLSTPICSLKQRQSHEHPKNDEVLTTLDEEERKKKEEALAGRINDLEFDKMVSEFTESDIFPVLPTRNCPLTQGQSHPTSDNPLERIEHNDENQNEGAFAGDQFQNIDAELTEDVVNRCSQWLSENLLEDLEWFDLDGENWK